MNFNEYVPLAMITLPEGKTKTEKILNACLGLVGEYAEYIEEETREKQIEELGDIHWYVALLSSANDFKNGVNTPSEENLIKTIGDVCDDVKKHVFQGHELNSNKIDSQIVKLLVALKKECKKLGTTQAKVMTMNIDKLKKRYPKGFEVEKSINRVI